MPPKQRKSINSKKNKILCLQCKTEVLENEDSVECDACNKTLHAQCSLLDKVQIDRLINNDSLSYKCHICVPGNDNNSQLSTILLEMREMKETMKFMSLQYDDILKGVKKNTKTIQELKKENKELKDDVNNLKETVSFLNNVRVRNDCVINGLKYDEKVNAADIVLNIAKQTGAKISGDDVEDAYFVSRRAQSNKSSVVVKFANKRSKTVFMKEKRKLRYLEDTKNIYINDFLSRDNIALLKHAQSLKSAGYKFIFSANGSIFAKQRDDSRPIRIKSLDDVDNLMIKSTTAVPRRTNIYPQARTNEPEPEDDEEDDDFLSPTNGI